MDWSSVLIIISFLHACVRCCPDRCFCTNDAVTCTDLRYLPIILPTSVSELTFHGLNVSNIPPHAFANLPNLHTLEFYSSSIGSIEGLAFDGISGIDYVTIYGSAIGYIKSFAFSGVHNVSLISIYNTKIVSIESMAFSHMTRVRDWQLYSLEIRIIASFAFHNISGLSNFMFYANKVNKIKTSAFSHFTNIDDFEFYMNAINYIECGNVENMMSRAEKVRFYNNKFDCVCSLIWMLRSDRLKNQLLSNKCHFPNKVTFIPLDKISQTELGCEDYENRFVIGCPPPPSVPEHTAQLQTNSLPDKHSVTKEGQTKTIADNTQNESPSGRGGDSKYDVQSTGVQSKGGNSHVDPGGPVIMLHKKTVTSKITNSAGHVFRVFNTMMCTFTTVAVIMCIL